MIYFIKSGEFVKIGHCERDPIRRLEKLQIGNPVVLELIGVAEGGRSEEGNWHARFDCLRVRGEWFKLQPKLMRAIKPHAVEHDRWSRNRPTRTIEGLPAWKVDALIASVSNGTIDNSPMESRADLANRGRGNRCFLEGVRRTSANLMGVL